MKLSDRIWLTKKCRMEAESRFNRYDNFSKFLITYYSAFILILSLYDIINTTVEYNISIVSASMLILIVSLIITSMRFKERSLAHKQCYIKLDELQQEIAKNENDDQIESEVFKKYNDVLNLTENHSEYDYFKVKYYDKSKEEYLTISRKELLKMCIRWIIMFLSAIIIVTLPLIIWFYDK